MDMRILIVCLLLNSCTIIRFKPKYEGINPEIKPYVEEFVHASKGKITKSHIENLSMELVNMRSDNYFKRSVGICWWTLNGNREIEINSSSWRWRTDKSRMSLIFHELGHCVYHRVHSMDIPSPTKWYENLWNFINGKLVDIGFFENYEYYEDGCPKSLMYPTTIYDRCVELHYNDYVEEMFKSCDP